VGCFRTSLAKILQSSPLPNRKITWRHEGLGNFKMILRDRANKPMPRNLTDDANSING
jgi:hypothetical protein